MVWLEIDAFVGKVGGSETDAGALLDRDRGVSSVTLEGKVCD